MSPISRYRTVIHLPVEFTTPPGTAPEDYARFMGDEAAMELEKFSSLDDITVGDVLVDPVVPAAAPTAPCAVARHLITISVAQPDTPGADRGAQCMATAASVAIIALSLPLQIDSVTVTRMPADTAPPTATSNADAAGWHDTPGGAA